MPDARTFFREFARDPTGVGSVTPSSRFLAEAMVNSARIEPGQTVVELGAGTGPVTRVLAELGEANPVMALEPVPEMAALLREIEGVEVREAYAQALPELLADWGHPVAHRVVSSLPFAAWKDELQDEILDAVLSCMPDDGVMVTFTYVHSQVLPAARKLKAKLEQRFQTLSKSPTVVRNVPPAFVWIGEGPKR